jgi:hypothetical protein
MLCFMKLDCTTLMAFKHIHKVWKTKTISQVDFSLKKEEHPKYD